MYYAITNNEDGEVGVSEHTKEDLEQKLNEGYWGERIVWRRHPGTTDPNYWNNGSNISMLIIKGEVVTPHEVRAVTEYKLP